LSQENDKKKATPVAEEIHVKVDNEQTKALAMELAEERESSKRIELENAELRGKLEFVAEKELEKKLRQHPELTPEQIADFHQNPEKLQSYEQGKSARSSEAPSGSAPMNAQQLGSGPTSNLRTRKFNSMEEMVRTLKETSQDSTNPERQDAQLALDQLMSRCIGGIKGSDPNKLNLNYNPNPQTPESSSNAPVEIQNFSQLKVGKSEIRECLDKANEIARQKLLLAKEREQALAMKQNEAKLRENKKIEVKES
jgi:hypothetical protein